MRVFVSLAGLLLTPLLALSQQVPAVTAADYARAERYLGYNVNPLVRYATTRPAWLATGEAWYRLASARGTEFMLVNPARRTRARAFDQGALARALNAAAGATFDSLRLPFSQLGFSTDKQSITVDANGRRWTCHVVSASCAGVPAQAGGRNSVLSPDGKKAAFIKAYNLWVRDITSGQETQLTTDGVKDFGYATDNAGWTRSDRPVLLWSPDSRKIATFQQDERAVGEMYTVETRVHHPVLQAWKYPLPGDSVIQMIHRVVIDLSEATPRVIRLQLPPDPHRSTTCDHIFCDGQFADVEWSPDGSQLVFVSSSRDHKRADVRVADPATGAVRDLFSETEKTFFESGFDSRNWRVLWDLKEILWYSQRDDWGHLYRYDLATGQEKWKWTDDGTAYASPALLTVGNDKVVVAETDENLVAVDAASGRLLWQAPFAVTGRGYNASTPMVEGQTILVAGSNRGMRAVRIEKQGDKLSAKEIWVNPNSRLTSQNGKRGTSRKSKR